MNNSPSASAMSVTVHEDFSQNICHIAALFLLSYIYIYNAGRAVTFIYLQREVGVWISGAGGGWVFKLLLIFL